MKYATLLVTLMQSGILGLARDGMAEVVVPVKVVASSNVGTGSETPRWHVDALLWGAWHFNLATGTNVPYGLPV